MKSLINKPIGIERIIENGSIEHLISLTKSYCEVYGKDRVRSPIMIDCATMNALDDSRKKSLLVSQTNNVNSSDFQNSTVLDYMIYLKNRSIFCGRRCSCINRMCPHIDTDSD
jgi:hypothetical protein